MFAARNAVRAVVQRAPAQSRSMSAPAKAKVNFEKDSVVGKGPYIWAGLGVAYCIKGLVGGAPKAPASDAGPAGSFAALKAERLARLDDISAALQAKETEHADNVKSLTEEAAKLRAELTL
jgi:hypothetical protein